MDCEVERGSDYGIGHGALIAGVRGNFAAGFFMGATGLWPT